jgi:hypothetical protein
MVKLASTVGVDLQSTGQVARGEKNKETAVRAEKEEWTN